MKRRDRNDGERPLSEQAARQRRRVLERQRLLRRRRTFGVIAAVVVIAGLGYGAYVWAAGHDTPPMSEPAAQAASPVRVDIGPPPEEAGEPADGASTDPVTTGEEFGFPPDEETTTKRRSSSTVRTSPRRAPKATAKAAGGAAAPGAEPAGASPSAGRPVVWIQAGHETRASRATWTNPAPDPGRSVRRSASPPTWRTRSWRSSSVPVWMRA